MVAANELIILTFNLRENFVTQCQTALSKELNGTTLYMYSYTTFYSVHINKIILNSEYQLHYLTELHIAFLLSIKNACHILAVHGVIASYNQHPELATIFFISLSIMPVSIPAIDPFEHIFWQQYLEYFWK